MPNDCPHQGAWNPILLDMVPSDAYRVLDVGCAGGEFGRRLKERQECHVTGIEILPENAGIAAACLDLVHRGDAVRILPLLPRANYDCIVLGDVLEHMIDPMRALLALPPLLTPSGSILISIPNVAHWSVIEGLLKGRWDYTELGLLDKTHLRFFTQATFEEMLRRAGLDFRLRFTTQSGPPAEITEELVEGHSIYQYLYEVWPANDLKVAQADYTTAIVIPAHGDMWPMTQACLESIWAHTPQPIRVIVVDDGTVDGGAESPEDYAENHPRLEIVRSAVNERFSRACNHGLATALADEDVRYVLFLNNDTLVTEGWLGRLFSCLDRHPKAGIVGPMTNYASGMQKLPGAPKVAPGDAGAVAVREAVNQLGRGAEVGAVVGFCLMGKREVFEAIGSFDEQFVNGFEEPDFCVRASDEGWQSWVARDAFVYHIGSQTFEKTGADYWGLIEENYKRFTDKWPGLIHKVVDYRTGSGWFFIPKRHPRVFWSVLFERAMFWESADVLMDLSAAAAVMKYNRIAVPYMAVDSARNHLSRLFLTASRNPEDVLIMLDADHYHPPEVLERLAVRKYGVVAALAFRRGAPYDPQVYVRQEDGRLRCPAEWPDGALFKADAVGTGGIAIKRWVFDRLEMEGYPWPFFRFTYPEGTLNRGGEDMYFGEACEAIGIPCYCDTTLVIPHMIPTVITKETWDRYKKEHPEILTIEGGPIAS